MKVALRTKKWNWVNWLSNNAGAWQSSYHDDCSEMPTTSGDQTEGGRDCTAVIREFLVYVVIPKSNWSEGFTKAARLFLWLVGAVEELIVVSAGK